jgi:hypothetical protein
MMRIYGEFATIKPVEIDGIENGIEPKSRASRSKTPSKSWGSTIAIQSKELLREAAGKAICPRYRLWCQPLRPVAVGHRHIGLYFR